MQQRLVLRRDPRGSGHRRERLDALALRRGEESHAVIPQRPDPIRVANNLGQSVHESLETVRAVALHHILRIKSALGAYASLSRPRDAAF